MNTIKNKLTLFLSHLFFRKNAIQLPEVFMMNPDSITVVQSIPSNYEHIIPIVFSCNHDYLVHTGVTITSVLLNAKVSSRYAYDFYILCTDGIEEIDWKPWKVLQERFCNEVKFNLTFLDASKLIDASRIDTGRFTTATLSRLAISTIEAFQKFSKLLYLDSDIIAYNLPKLWENEMILPDGQPAWAIGMRDCGQATNFCSKTMKRSGVKDFPNDEYINAGILILNIAALKEFEFTKKSLIFLQERKRHLLDQDAINVVLQGKIRILNYEYNWPIIFDSKKTLSPRPPEIHMLHYVGAWKPWTEPDKASLMESEYYRYRQLSPWAYPKG
jgi:lipopolysaccharide biosynthesis glycosyltransferase